MKLLLLFFALQIFGVLVYAQPKNTSTLWYLKPAKIWEEALPIGNGRLGAMVFGRIKEETLQLNEQTLWTGGPEDLNPQTEAPKYLPLVREALFAGNYGEAIKNMRKIQGHNCQMYQPLGDVEIYQNIEDETSSYYRDLDLTNAIATTRFSVNGTTFTREVFSSAPDQVIVLRLSSSTKGSLNFGLNVRHELKYEKVIASQNEIVLKGKARITSDSRRAPLPIIYNDSLECKGMRFQFRVRVVSTDGKVSADSMINISNATEAVVLISAATSFNGFDKCPVKEGKDEELEAKKYLESATNKTFDQLYTAHYTDFQKFYNRVTLSLTDKPVNDKPTDVRADRKTG
jgi:alpha-L-fucosidase 2